METVLPLRTACRDSGYPFGSSLRDVHKQRFWKRGSGDFRDGETTTRLSDRSMPFPLCASPLKGEVQRSPEPSARPSAAADSEERQICTTCFFAESVGLCLCFLPSSAMYKDKAVANVVAEMGRDLVFMTAARLSDLSMPLKGEVRRSTWTVCTAADCEERQICTTCLFAESNGLWKVDGLVCWSTRLFERGDQGKKGDLTWQPAVKHQTTCQNHKQQQLRPRSAPSKGAQTRTTRVKVQQVLSKYSGISFFLFKTLCEKLPTSAGRIDFKLCMITLLA